MLETLERLLILQDRDRHIRRVQSELARLGPDREALQARLATAQAALETARQRLQHLETQRKQLELDVQAKEELIARYTNQQFQTRKNEEYRALAHEIEQCRAAIRQIEDRELELMEQAEAGQKEIGRATEALKQTRAFVDEQLASLGSREQNLKAELARLQADRETLAAAVEPEVRQRYERLLKSRGDNLLVGIPHGVCAGCHMRLPAQVVVSCRASQEIITCPNCGRILYYTPDMDMAVVD